MGTALFIVFAVLVLMGIPLAFCLSGSALLAFAGWSDFPATIVIQKFFTGSDSFTLLAIPFFMMSGSIMSRGGVSKRLIDLFSMGLKNVPGGLAMVTIVCCAFFGAISGSAPATCAAIGGIMVPAMIEHMHLEDRVGYIKPGYNADLVFLNENPFEKLETVCAVAGVIHDGQVICGLS